MPVGYDLSVDGYLEAQKVPEAGCQFACFGIHEARLDFPRRPQADFGPKDGKFRIEGHFLPCNTDSVLDPATVDVRVGIGDYVQELPAGLLEAERHHTSWSFENHHAVEAITEFELERHRNGQWEFVIEGRGIPRATLIGNDNLLELELVIGTASGSDQVTLVQKKHKLRFKGDDDECEPEGDGDDDHLMPQQPPPTTIATTTLLGASPNPFNATTQIVVNSVSAGNLRLRIFDVRGRLVRTLHDGALPTGMHQFTWKGDDEQGRGVASGVYVYRLEAAGVAESRKLVVAK
jgi:hypothetical protein